MVEKCDCLVIGGGVAGVMAAIAASRNGVNVTLLERGGCLGGMWTSGLIGLTLDGYQKCPLLDEFFRLVKSETDKNVATIFETQKYVLENMCKKENIRILYHSQVFEVKTNNKIIEKVKYISKSGVNELIPKVVIDSTGDGDIADMIGCDFDYGRPEDGKTQPMSMIALLTGIDAKVAENYISYRDKPFWDARNNLKELLDKAGIEVSLGSASIVPLTNDVYILSVNQEYGKSGCNADELTCATINARAEIHEFVNKLKIAYPEYFKNMSIVATPEAIGVRESRRIKCKYTVTLDDMIEGKHHQDAICTVRYWPDIHSPEKDAKGFSDGGLKIQPYDIPFRALLPLGTENFMVAGRSIGGDFYAHSSYRVMGNMAAVGDAAGKVAAKAIITNTPVSEITYSKTDF